MGIKNLFKNLFNKTDEIDALFAEQVDTSNMSEKTKEEYVRDLKDINAKQVDSLVELLGKLSLKANTSNETKANLKEIIYMLKQEPNADNYKIKKNLSLVIGQTIKECSVYCDMGSDIAADECLTNIKNYIFDGATGNKYYEDPNYVKAIFLFHQNVRFYQIAMTKIRPLRQQNEKYIEEYNSLDKKFKSRRDELSRKVKMNNAQIVNELQIVDDACENSLAALTTITALIKHIHNDQKQGGKTLYDISEVAREMAVDNVKYKEKLEQEISIIDEYNITPTKRSTNINPDDMDDDSYDDDEPLESK